MNGSGRIAGCLASDFSARWQIPYLLFVFTFTPILSRLHGFTTLSGRSLQYAGGIARQNGGLGARRTGKSHGRRSRGVSPGSTRPLSLKFGRCAAKAPCIARSLRRSRDDFPVTDLNPRIWTWVGMTPNTDAAGPDPPARVGCTLQTPAKGIRRQGNWPDLTGIVQGRPFPSTELNVRVLEHPVPHLSDEPGQRGVTTAAMTVVSHWPVCARGRLFRAIRGTGHFP